MHPAAERLLQTYTPLHNLPPLAGVCDFPTAMEPGLSVEECVRRLLRLHYVMKRLGEAFTFRIPEEPTYELKMAYSLHAHQLLEHVSAIRNRVAEMRQPPLGLEKIPHPDLETLVNEVQFCPLPVEFLAGAYQVLVPALLESVERYLRETHPLADHPTCRLLRFARLELRDMQEYGAAALDAFESSIAEQVDPRWTALLNQFLIGAGELDGTAPESDVGASPKYGDTPRPVTLVPQRDERFTDPYNMGVHAEEFLYDQRFSPRDKTLMMYFKRLREIDVPEMMATILHETPDKPWGYYRDMTRQLWDEARHAMLGEVGFLSLGIDWPQYVQVNHTWALGLNTQLQAWERHAVLFFIEQGLMTKTGKRFEWEVGTASGDKLSETFQDYDWADEVLHARIGRDWYVSEFADLNEAIRYGDECWSKVLLNWQSWKDEGLTQHANWWPALYQQFCTLHDLAPDAEAATYDVTYATSRADLEKLGFSG
ncbi:MAG: hypothetical protein KDA58_08095 [Planctomycetaceae bacterium]|nr:hypothetical protein [Planctomycetaceae bacterium]